MEQKNETIHLDFSIEDPAARTELVKKIIANTPSEKLTPRYLEKLSDYIVIPKNKQKRKEKKIITENRLSTFNDREKSYEGMVNKMENGEDGMYNLIRDNDKGIIFKPKTSITEEDIAEIPPLRQLYEEIKKVEAEWKTAHGPRAFRLRKQLIAMRKDQYVIKAAYRRPIYCLNLIRSFPKIDLSEEIFVNEESGEVLSTGLINFFNPKHVSAILCNYSKLKEDSWDKISGDAKWMMADFDDLVEKSIKDKYPLYYKLLIYKIDGLQNAEIQILLNEEFGIHHSIEYISSLWRNKIPKLIAETAVNDYLNWYYTYQKPGKWKRCSRCGQIKLAHNNFFSKNKTSKDGWYSICKECRSTKVVK